MPIATRLSNTGTLLVNGIFDEQTDNLVYNSNLTLYLNASKTSSYSGTGATWSDLSGNGNNATLIGSPTYTTTQVGAIRFNASGTGQSANVPVAAIPSGGSQVSVCCWINLGNPATPPAASVFNCNDSAGNRIINIHLPWNDSIVYWDAGNSGGTYNRINTSTLTLAQKTGWHHWAFTLNATAGTMAIYLDGVSIATGTGKTLTLGTASTATVPCAIANFQGGANWNGSVSSFQIYNVALTAAQVAQNYSATSGPFTKFKTTSTTVYATEFDEVTINGGSVAKREINTGVLQVKNIFDEFTGAPVVDTSLQLWLDAGQTVSYPGSGTTWTDLSGAGRNGTLTNGPTYASADGGSIVFDGTNDYVQCSGSLTVTAATFVCWIKRNGNQGQYDGILFSRGTNTTGMNFQTSNQLGYHWNNAGNTYNWQSGLTVPDATWCMIAVSVTSTAATAYLCQTGGTTTATNTVNHSSSVLDDIKIAWDEAAARYFNGNIATAMVYNRALTADEVTTNFNALRGRYGV